MTPNIQVTPYPELSNLKLIESLRNSFVPSSFVSTGTSVFDQDFDTTFKESTLNDQSFIDPSQKLLADDNMFPEVFEEKKLPEDQKEEEVPTAESIIQKMKNDEAIAAERDKVHNRESSPFIKTVMAERTIVESEYFNMHAWAEFQEILRSNFFVIKNGKQKMFFRIIFAYLNRIPVQREHKYRA